MMVGLNGLSNKWTTSFLLLCLAVCSLITPAGKHAAV